MRYHLYLVRELPTEAPTHIPIATIDSEAPNPSLEAQLEARVLEAANQALAASAMSLPLGAPDMAQPGRRTGRKSRKVIVRSIEPEERPRVPVNEGEIVESGLELSLLLGYGYNMVTQALSLASRKQRALADKEQDRAERQKIESEVIEATLRGVTFCYVEELGKNEK